jgi:hypothetical protein
MPRVRVRAGSCIMRTEDYVRLRYCLGFIRHYIAAGR